MVRLILDFVKKTWHDSSVPYIVEAQKMDAITKRLWDQLEKELKDLYDYLDLMTLPKEEKEECGKKD